MGLHRTPARWHFNLRHHRFIDRKYIMPSRSTHAPVRHVFAFQDCVIHAAITCHTSSRPRFRPMGLLILSPIPVGTENVLINIIIWPVGGATNEQKCKCDERYSE